jgi:hypothetical protein
MRGKLALACLASAVLLGFPQVSRAQVLFGSIPDGRVTDTVSVPAGGTVCFYFHGRAGRSYSVEVYGPIDGFNTADIFFGAADEVCPIVDDPGYNFTDTNDPPLKTVGGGGGLEFFGRRGTFVAPTTAFYQYAATNTGAGVAQFTFSVSDTTQFSPTWSTNGSFDTFYSFQNTSSASITGTLVLRNTAGTIVDTAPLTILPGATASVNTSSMGTPRNTTGTASFTHDGPAGAIQTEAAVANFTLATPYVQTVKFAPTREVNH